MRTRLRVPSRVFGAASLVLTLVVAPTPSAGAQVPGPVAAAPVPAQITAARRVFVSNAGSDSYGPEVYYQLTKYDGGPDRLYNMFYSGLVRWGRLELVGEPARADVVYAVRFASPAVARRDSLELLYDPQINLTIIDPATRVTLWSMTEHIEPARTRSEANDHFDRAVLRLVDRTRLLTESPADAARVAAAPPAGADREFVLNQRRRHAASGLAIGFFLGAAYSMSSLRNVCPPPTAPTDCSPHAPIIRSSLVTVGAATVGALIGWMLPVRSP